MTARAFVRHEFAQDKLRILVATRYGDGSPARVPSFERTDQLVASNETSPDDAGFLLDEDEARAVYEVLAEHFGHTTNDTRRLLRDYDAERARVDKFIEHLIQVDQP